MSFSIGIDQVVLDKNLKFKEGEKIDWSKKNLKEKSETDLVIYISDELKIAPKDIFKHLKVSLGDTVKKDDILATKKGFMSTTTFKTPVEAEIRKIDHQEGTITLAVSDVIDVPFIFKAVFVKKEKTEFIFKVKSGVEIALVNSLPQSFGGTNEYINKNWEVDLEKCENKVVVTKNIGAIDMAKLSALGPAAIVSYELSYANLSTPLLLLTNKTDWANLFEKKWQYCLYLANQKTVYFYNYD